MLKREVKLVTYTERARMASTRLHEICGDSADRVCQLRNSEKNSNIEQRCELAYITQVMQWAGERPVEVCIAGRPEDPYRRVFSKCTSNREHDGTVLDLYTKKREPRPWAIPFSVEKPASSRRVKKESSDV